MGARRQFVGEGDIPAVLYKGNLAKPILRHVFFLAHV
jgi:hypothetical protein